MGLAPLVFTDTYVRPAGEVRELPEYNPMADAHAREAVDALLALDAEALASVKNLKEAFNLGAHEMGHVLGVGRAKSNLDVMYPTSRTDDELPLSDHTSVGDIAELQATYAANSNDTCRRRRIPYGNRSAPAR